MYIKDHGDWEAYKPQVTPEGLPLNVLYAKRRSDQKDWYEYLKEGHFKLNTVKFQVRMDGFARLITGNVVTDPSHLFPAGTFIIEMEYKGDKERFNNKLYDRVNHTFSDWPENPSVVEPRT